MLSRAANTISIRSLNKRFSNFEGQLRNALFLFLEFLKKRGVSIDVYLIGNNKMRELKRIYKNKDETANVLAVEPPKGFPMAGNKSFLGEVYLNVPYIRKEKEDIEYLLLHALLHLLGFKHETKSDRMKMENLELKIIKWLNTKP